ncbi:MAG TPA: hypothetical protein VM939_12570 [Gemmatimonadaceae bacterium]|nr:hypothetical protein [Gemmatimonadaceae bacterium]
MQIVVPGPGGTNQVLQIPKTADELQELRIQRQEMSDQLTSVASRRASLSEQIRTAPEGASRSGLEERLRILDQRILQLETDLAITGRQISMAPTDLRELAAARSGSDEMEELFAFGAFLVFVVVPVVYGIRWWRRRRKGKQTVVVPTESKDRLERLEQGMEAIAIEIERISEGQRFVTRLLSESRDPIGVSQRLAKPVAVEQGGTPDR